MSHKGGRKSHTSTLSEEKDKRSSDGPVKEMKKKIAANAEKEKQVSDKTDKTVTSPERSNKNADKVAEKPQTEKTDTKKANSTEKVDKNAPTPDKNAQKPDKKAEKTDKNTEKEKVADKKTDKVADDKVADKKVDKPVEKKNEPEKKDDGKGEGKDKLEKPKQNGSNGDTNGIMVSDSDSSDEELVIDDQDEVFPELAYDDTSDLEYEEGAPSRSFTRRSQVKATKTPETPRPASVKEDDSKEKVLKMNDSLATDRKLRSADSPKHEVKKPTEQKKAQDSPKKDKTIDLTEDELIKETEEESGKKESGKNESGKEEIEKTAGKNKLEMEVVVELEGIDESRSRTRARVSPFSSRLAAKHDNTTSSLTANYTGNNTTMEMDITETSSILEDNLDDSYLRGLRTIKGRSSYKPLKELSLKHTLNRSVRSNTPASTSLLETARPTGTVVGRKRKPDAEGEGEAADVLSELAGVDAAGEATDLLYAHHKRMRLFDRFSAPFRGFGNTRDAEIVGINTDLPLTAPVASTSSYDPETLKPSLSDPVTAPLTSTQDRDSKRCAIM